MEFGGNLVYVGQTNEEEEIPEEDDLEENDEAVGPQNGDEETCCLDILDTAGQEEYSSTRNMYMASGDGFMIIYSITSRTSFNEASSIYGLIQKIRGMENSHVILCGNKSDLEHQREISFGEGKKLADSWGIPFVETSAKTGSLVKEAFEKLVLEIPEHKATHKIVMLGAGAVGKSSLTLRFVADQFVEDYDPTIEDSYRKMIKVKGKRRKVNEGEQGRPRQQVSRVRSFISSISGIFSRRSSRPRSATAEDFPVRQRSYGGLPIGRRKSAPPIRSPTKSKKTIKCQKADTNVILVSMKDLDQMDNVATGDPVYCDGCQVVLSCISETQQDGDKLLWNCEFCGHKNVSTEVRKEEIPKTDTIDYALSAPEEQAATGKETDEPEATKPATTGSGYVVYCLDISGSMGGATQLPELQAEWKRQRDGEYAAGSDSVTRLQAIQEALRRQLERLHLDSPDRRVIFMTFESKVEVYGDCSDDTIQTVPSSIHNEFEPLLNYGEKYSTEHQIKPLTESYQKVVTEVNKLRPKGCTSLGPALSVALGIVNGSVGSEIILCTDGAPNGGIGNLSRNTDQNFYVQAGEYAKKKNITISILAVEGERTGLEKVSKCADISGGTVNVLNPLEISRQLRLISQNYVIATYVTVTLFLHPELEVDDPRFPKGSSKIIKEVGSATKDTDMTFSFKLKNPGKKLDVQKIPFQVQISYTLKDGRNMLRTISKALSTTDNRQTMEEAMNVNVVGTAVVQKTAYLASKGDVEDARSNLLSSKRMISKGSKNLQQQEDRVAFIEESRSLSHVVNKLHKERQTTSSLSACGFSDMDTAVLQANVMQSAGKLSGASKKMQLVKSRLEKNKAVSEAYYGYKQT